LSTSPGSPPDFFHTLGTLIESFPASAPPFCLINALALSAWGQPRATKDINLLILLNEESQGRLLSALASFTVAYANQNEKDHAALKRAIRAGKIKARDEEEK